MGMMFVFLLMFAYSLSNNSRKFHPQIRIMGWEPKNRRNYITETYFIPDGKTEKMITAFYEGKEENERILNSVKIDGEIRSIDEFYALISKNSEKYLKLMPYDSEN